jgi:hypothetical protein
MSEFQATLLHLFIFLKTATIKAYMSALSLQDCPVIARLPGKSAGQVCRASLPGKSAGQSTKFIMAVYRKKLTQFHVRSRLIMSDHI